MRFIWLIGFLLTIPAANWMIGHVGACHPNAPCLVPVWPGIMAPSGVLMIGLAFVLRDLVHRSLGWQWTIGAIVAGAGLSWFIAPALALASGAAFLFSELADMAIYSPLYRKRFLTAVVVSSTVGAAVDSALFLWLAFGSLQFLQGQIIGKFWMIAAASAVIALSGLTRRKV